MDSACMWIYILKKVFAICSYKFLLFLVIYELLYNRIFILIFCKESFRSTFQIKPKSFKYPINLSRTRPKNVYISIMLLSFFYTCKHIHLNFLLYKRIKFRLLTYKFIKFISIILFIKFSLMCQ